MNPMVCVGRLHDDVRLLACLASRALAAAHLPDTPPAEGMPLVVAAQAWLRRLVEQLQVRQTVASASTGRAVSAPLSFHHDVALLLDAVLHFKGTSPGRARVGQSCPCDAALAQVGV